MTPGVAGLGVECRMIDAAAIMPVTFTGRQFLNMAAGVASAIARRLIVVTGSNKGIGLEIVRRLLASHDLAVVLTSRDEKRGLDAIKSLTGAGLQAPLFHTLDITDEDSCAALAAWVEREHGGKLFALVNNAGFAFKGNAFGADEARQTMDVNYRGTRRATEALLPCLRKAGSGARIINVSSRVGRLGQLSAELQARFSAPDLTLAQLDALVDEFVADIRAGNHEAKGWSNSMYGVSKLACTAYTRILARDEAEAAVAAIACCPGWCQTDMSSKTGPRTAAKGAETPAELARLPLSELEERGIKSGGFAADMAAIDWVSSRIVE